MATFYYGGTGTDPLIRIEVYETPSAGTFNLIVTQVQSTDADAFLDSDSKYYLGDLRAFYLDFASAETFTITNFKSYAGYDATGTPIATAPTSTSVVSEGVTSVGSKDTNMNGADGGTFDAGIEIGTSGIGKDDVGSISFTVTGSTALTFQDFLTASFGIRVTSVGLDVNKDGDVADKGETRTASSKIAYETPGAPEPAIVTIGDATAGEGENLIFSVTLSNASALPITLDLATSAGTASASEFESGNFEYSIDAGATWLAATGPNGSLITIPAGHTAFQVRVNTTDGDVYAEGPETLSLNAWVVSGSVASVVPGTGTITDDADVVTASLGATALTGEDGGSITYTVTLSGGPGAIAPTAPLSFLLANGETVTIAAGATSGSVIVPVSRDDVYVEADSITNAIAGVSAGGSEYEALTVDPATVTTTITDDADVTTVMLSDPTVDEGDSATIMATLNNAVQGTPLLITLSNGSSIMIAVGATSGMTAPFTASTNATVTVVSTSGGTFEALNTTDAANVTVIPDPDTTISGLHFDPSAEPGNSAKLGSFVAENPTGAVHYDAVVTRPGGGSVTGVDVESDGDLVIGGGALGEYTVAVTVYDLDGNPVGDSETYNLWVGNNTAESFSFTLTSTNNIGAAQGGADVITGSSGEDFLYGGSGNDILMGRGGNDWLYGGGNNDKFAFVAPMDNGTDTLADFTESGSDTIALLQGAGGWNASVAGSLLSAGGTTLAAADYAEVNNLSNLAGTNNKVVELQQAQTTAAMTSTLGAAVNAYVVLFNSTTGRGELWHDSNWSDIGSRSLVASIENFDALTDVTALARTNFAEWIL